jgi:dTDP-glucose pyrophosphorylase
MRTDFNILYVNYRSTILSALKKMDSINRKLLIVVDENNKFYSLISIGDIQRAILDNVSIQTMPIKTILRDTVKVATEDNEIDEIKENMQTQRIEFMPIINTNNDIINILFWEDLFTVNKLSKNKINLPVVIMAGGKGTRLQPLTSILPKPLIPISNQSMLEDIMDSFKEYDCNDFFISVNYKADFIKLYFNSISDKKYNINYFQENKPLGTAGSLRLIKESIKTTFFVSNCDIIIDQNYNEILNYHNSNKNEITCVAAIKNISLPYGVFETKENGQLFSISEKPEYSYKINTGLYILEPHLLNEIPEDKFFHITSLIEKLLKENRKVGIFPISQNSWTDIGNWEEYRTYINGKK